VHAAGAAEVQDAARWQGVDYVQGRGGKPQRRLDVTRDQIIVCAQLLSEAIRLELLVHNEILDALMIDNTDQQSIEAEGRYISTLTNRRNRIEKYIEIVD
jgi:hypothetical protein